MNDYPREKGESSWEGELSAFKPHPHGSLLAERIAGGGDREAKTLKHIPCRELFHQDYNQDQDKTTLSIKEEMKSSEDGIRKKSSLNVKYFEHVGPSIIDIKTVTGTV